MLSVKNTKALSKAEIARLNVLINSFHNNEYDDTDSDIFNILDNDFVIYEGANNDISGMLGLCVKNDESIAIINQFYVLDGNLTLASKLISMIKMISKNTLLMIVEKSNSEFIEFLKTFSFDIYQDLDTEIIMQQKRI